MGKTDLHARGGGGGKFGEGCFGGVSWRVRDRVRIYQEFEQPIRVRLIKPYLLVRCHKALFTISNV